MSRRVMSLFHGRFAGGTVLMAACLLALAVLFSAPLSAAAATGEVATVYWKKGTASGYEIQATVTTTSLAETVTVSGPNIATTDLYPTADGQGMVFEGTATFVPSTSAAIPVVNTAYTLNINYGAGGPAAETVTARISNVLGSSNIPGLTAPLPAVASTDNPTFYWSAPSTPPANLSGYSVSVSGPSAFQWSIDIPSTLTSVAYDGAALEAATPYDWGVAAMDMNGNKAENRGTFVLGVNFTGKVTDINGLPLEGIEVQAANSEGLDMGIVTTAADGTYMYAGLAPGDYKVHFDFRAYYWRNKLDSTTADVLTVTAGSVTSNVNAVIGGWGAISGTVYVTGAYKPVAAQVTLLDANRNVVSSVPTVDVQLSAGYGQYYMALVRPGNYYLRFTAPGYSPVEKPVTVIVNTTLEGAAAPYAMFSTPVSNTLTVQTSGAGTVTGSGISCTAGSTSGCSSSYTAGTVVTLSATSSAGSVFGGWSGACTGTASCVVTIDTAKNVTAIFTTKPATVRIDGSSTGYFSVAKALDSLLTATAPQTVRAKTESFVEDVIMATPAQVSFKGGYTDTADAFTTRSATSRSVIDGSLRIRKGKLIAERLVIR